MYHMILFFSWAWSFHENILLMEDVCFHVIRFINQEGNDMKLITFIINYLNICVLNCSLFINFLWCNMMPQKKTHRFFIMLLKYRTRIGRSTLGSTASISTASHYVGNSTISTIDITTCYLKLNLKYWPVYFYFKSIWPWFFPGGHMSYFGARA